MTSDTRERPRLTPKGERTRARIIDAAARLIYERGVAGTTLEDIRASAEVSGSQLQHYFADKDELVQAVIGHQADTIVGNQRQADLGDAGGLQSMARHGDHHGKEHRRPGRLSPRVARRPAR